MTNANMGRPVGNKFKVPSKQWKKWSNHARKVFNEMMKSATPHKQWMFLHPQQPTLPAKHWATTQWNFAWIAAGIADGAGTLAGVKPDGNPKAKTLTRRPKHEARRKRRG